MRTSGGGGSDGWMMFIPLLALLVFSSYATGGGHALLLTLDSIVRTVWQSVVNFVSSLF
jgi:hypothetical protein